MPLNEQYRNRLSGVVRQMMSESQAEDSIQQVVDVFKRKYEPVSQAETTLQSQPDYADRIIQKSSISRRDYTTLTGENRSKKSERKSLYDNLFGDKEDRRLDGTRKGMGFLGELPHAEGGTSTELSIGVNIDNKETEIPSLVPTLTQKEINHMLSGADPTESIVQKAVEHAKKRMSQGKSPFAEQGESPTKTKQPVSLISPEGITESPTLTTERDEGPKDLFKEFYGAHPEVKQLYDTVFGKQEQLMELFRSEDDPAKKAKYQELFNIASEGANALDPELLQDKKAVESYAKSLYLFTRDAFEGLTLGAGRAITPMAERAVLGEEGEGGFFTREVQPDNMREQMSSVLGSTLGTFLGASTIGKGLSEAQWMQKINNPLVKQAATRMGTALISSTGRTASGIIAGDIDTAEGLTNIATSVAGAGVSMLPEIYVKAGIDNFAAQIVTDAMFDYGTDKLRGRLDNKSFRDWFLLEELPQLGLSAAMAARDYSDKNFPKQQELMRQAMSDIGTKWKGKLPINIAQKLKNDIKSKFGKGKKPKIALTIEEAMKSPLVIREPEALPETIKQEVQDGVQKKQIEEQERISPQEADEGRVLEEPRQVGLTQAESERVLESIGRHVPEKLKIPAQQTYETAKNEGYDVRADSIAKSIVDSPRPLSAKEEAGLLIRKGQLSDARSDLMSRLNETDIIKDKKASKEILSQIADVEKNIETLEKASWNAGSEWGRAGQFRQMMLDQDRMSLERTLVQARKNKGAPLSPETEAQFKETIKKMEAMEQNIEKITAERDALEKQRASSWTKRQKSSKEISNLKKRGDLQEYRKYLKGQLEQVYMGKVADVTQAPIMGLEAARIVKKIAETYIAEGITKIDDLTERMRQDLPDIAKRQIWDSLGGRANKEIKKIETQLNADKKSIAKQARLMSDMDDALDGMLLPKKGKKINYDTKVAVLQSKLDDIEGFVRQTEKDNTKIEEVHNKVYELQEQLDMGIRPLKKKQKPSTEQIDLAKQKVADLRKIIRTQDKIYDIENQIATGNYTDTTVKQEYLLKSKEVQSKEVELLRSKRALNKKLYEEKPKFGRYAHESVDFLKAAKTTADMSAFLRQLMVSNINHPIRGTQGFAKAFRAMFSKNSSDEIMSDMLHHPNQWIRDKAGLELFDIGGGDKGLEYFRSNLIEKVPLFGKVTQASERNMATAINMMRVSVFDDYIKKNPLATNDRLRDKAKFLNIVTGSGTIPKKAQVLNYLLFAPKFAISKPELIYRTVAPEKWGGFETLGGRADAAKELATAATVAGGALALAAQFGLDVSMDPQSPDFLKIKDGNRRWDIFAGYQQPLRVAAKEAVSLWNVINGKRYKNKQDLQDELNKFLKFKRSVPWSMYEEIKKGKTVVGEKRKWYETLYRSVLPLTAENLVDDLYLKPTRESLEEKLGASGYEFFGGSTYSYKKKGKEKRLLW